MMNMIISKVEQLRDAVIPKFGANWIANRLCCAIVQRKCIQIVFVGVLLEISEHPFEMTGKNACFDDQIFDVSGDGIA